MQRMILIRGAGELASGIAALLFRNDYPLLLTELQFPLAVRRTVSFSEAIYDGFSSMEGITARRITSQDQIQPVLHNHEIPVLVDEGHSLLHNKELQILAIIDARMLKTKIDEGYRSLQILSIGIGPGFFAGQNCDYVVETSREDILGKIITSGEASPDTGQPFGDPTRILRAPKDGLVVAYAKIGDFVKKGQVIASVGGDYIHAPFTGLLRGLIHPGVVVKKNTKIGDIDHRMDLRLIQTISDKTQRIAESVLRILQQESISPGMITKGSINTP